METEEKQIWAALDRLKIEIPSWGFANTGTRFGKFLQASAATSIEEKFADAAQVHALTGCCPTIALHVDWDLPGGLADVSALYELTERYAIRAGSINPNLFQSQDYKYGSICNPDPAIRQKAIGHVLASIEIGQQLGSRDLSMWVADGSNYPGTQNMRHRIEWMEEALITCHAALSPNQRMLIEYKPFEPAFYHTDIADWGMSLELSQKAGPQARVLVDTGHHFQSQNVEQIVAWLLHLGMLGGFHLNDRKYADDDLTLGSIDPYHVFRIFHEILSYERDKGSEADVPFMIDQSHNVKEKVEAMVQTAVTAQELYARAAIVDRERLGQLQTQCRLVEAEECFRAAFWKDVRPVIREWRRARGIPDDPLAALRESGYIARISKERGEKNAKAVTTYA
jgi:L-rhamnose isomerase / sugar isomerase